MSLLVNLIPYAERGDIERIQRELADGAEIDARGISGYTPLLAALYAGQCETAKFLLERGVNPRLRARELADHDWDEVYSALHCAAIGGCHELVEPLVREGLDLEEPTEEGTPFILAARYDHPKTLEALLSHGADIDRRNHETEAWGTTPLIAAACEGCFAAVTTLIRHGTSVDVTWSGGHTALMIAAQLGYFSIVRLLCEAGADPDCQDNEGHTALTPLEGQVTPVSSTFSGVGR
jgi:ankyrin repeat protein